MLLMTLMMFSIVLKGEVNVDTYTVSFRSQSINYIYRDIMCDDGIVATYVPQTTIHAHAYRGGVSSIHNTVLKSCHSITIQFISAVANPTVVRLVRRMYCLLFGLLMFCQLDYIIVPILGC